MTSKAREIWNSVGVLALAVSSLLGPVEPAAKVGTPPMAVCVACQPSAVHVDGRWGVAPHATHTPKTTLPEGGGAADDGNLLGLGPPVFMYFADLPEGTTYGISGRGYGIAWGWVVESTPDRQGRTEWYTIESRRAVWWDMEGGVHMIAEEPIPVEIEGETYHFIAAMAERYRPELGMIEVQAFCEEYYEWMLQNPGVPTNDWQGLRYATLLVPITPPWADFDADGKVNTLDFNAFLNAWSAAQRVGAK